MGKKIIKDSVHGYIPIEEMFVPIIDSAEFQRLKSIEQGSFRVLYPAARHDRFIHSLGTYYLAQKTSKYFIFNMKSVLKEKVDEVEIDKIKRTFHYASLLHDIGHAPYSHTTEKFFSRKENTQNKYDKICIRQNLIDAIECISQDSGKRFREEFKDISPSPHEIISATILIKNASIFLEGNVDKIDLELAARMVIGNTYAYNEDGENEDVIGIKNCFIRLLNSKTVDVDKMDYITRDTQMSGFVNVPIDIERLVQSVTVIRNEDGKLYPGFKKNALSVIDNVFRAKTEQGIWMVSHPVVIYDSALLSQGIEELNNNPGDYIENLFSVEALGRAGKTVCGKEYHFLCDTDIGADLRKEYPQNAIIKEYFERNLRRKPVWKSYYEYRFLFGPNDEEAVFTYFKGLVDYLVGERIFILNNSSLEKIKKEEKNVNPVVPQAAIFLQSFCEKEQIEFDLALLNVNTSFSSKVDPGEVYISFENLPDRSDANKKYVSYHFLKGASNKVDNKKFFYLYSKVKFTELVFIAFKKAILKAIRKSRRV